MHFQKFYIQTTIFTNVTPTILQPYSHKIYLQDLECLVMENLMAPQLSSLREIHIKLCWSAYPHMSQDSTDTSVAHLLQQIDHILRI